MSEDFQGVNVQEPAAPATQELAQVSTTATEPAQTSEPATPTVQDRETNAAFAQYRREAEQARKDRDTIIAEAYGHQGITTWDQYQKAKAEYEAAQQRQNYLNQGIDPELINQLINQHPDVQQSRQERLALQRERTLAEQERTLETDPNVGTLFKQWKDDVKQLAQQTGADYDIAFTMLLRNKIPDILNSTKTNAEQDAVKKLINNSQTSPGSLSQGDTDHKYGYSQLSPAEKKAFREKVLRGEVTNF